MVAGQTEAAVISVVVETRRVSTASRRQQTHVDSCNTTSADCATRDTLTRSLHSLYYLDWGV